MESKLTHGYRGWNLLMWPFMSFFVHFLHENEKSESGKKYKKTREKKKQVKVDKNQSKN